MYGPISLKYTMMTHTTRTLIHLMTILTVIALLTACSKPQPPLSLHWELLANDVEPNICEAALTLTNHTSEPLENDDWLIGFSLMSLHPLYTEGDELRETEVQASYHTLTPTEAFTPLAAGESRTYKLRYKGSAVRQSSHPEGFFLVRGEQTPVSLPCTFAPYTRKEQMTRGIETWLKTPYADGEYMYAYINQRTTEEPDKAQAALPLFPQPKEVVYRESGTNKIAGRELRIMHSVALPAEGYWIIFDELEDNIIDIEVADEAGAFYARQTIKALGDETTIRSIRDWPDLHHRAMMLDISRNFYPADSILRVVDVMASLKLNVLHLHLADDEGWRIEIPALPQLTANGSSRGYTTDEADCLYPAYCGGWDKNDKTSTANGYLTREEYIRIVRYAAERHIRVIPEIDMPGHMRAIKKAMGDVLVDSELEKREYLSAQNYTDNVIAVTRPEALPTMRTIIAALVDMHNEAGQPLTVFNIGGDEVPKGALTREEHQAFIDGVLEILKEYNLQPAGWEEMTHFCPPESKAMCYSWHNGYGKAQEMADAGYPVVLATANHLYFDFAYCHHHEEKGLNWGGYTDEFDSFDWQPLEHENIIGISAQLWSEVIRSFAQVEWQLYPKMFGLSERAWNYKQSPLSVAEYGELVYGTYLPKLADQGSNFHLMQPGIHIEGGHVMINTIYPAGETVYTVVYKDGHSEQGTYTAPFALPDDAQQIQAQWHYLGHASNTTLLFL